jgi:glycosyltransferase involved in cell wall biosynthesis
MIGDGPLRAEATAIRASAGLSDLAWLPGERRDVAELMRAMDVFVLPSLAEGVSNTILEAMATGLPVIATAVGGNPELVDDGRTGRVVPPDDIAAMSSAMRQLVEDADLRVTMGRAARAEIEQRFSLQAMVQAYRKVYDKGLMQARGSPR